MKLIENLFNPCFKFSHFFLPLSQFAGPGKGQNQGCRLFYYYSGKRKFYYSLNSRENIPGHFYQCFSISHKAEPSAAESRF